MILGALIVVTYTTFGGMLSVAILDFIQMIMIMGGLLYIGHIFSGMTGGVDVVINHAAEAGKLFFPEANLAQWMTFFGAWLTLTLGSVPQTRRLPASYFGKERTRGDLGQFAVPCCISLSPLSRCSLPIRQRLLIPICSTNWCRRIRKMVLPALIRQHTPVIAQVFFYGAVLSAIMSTSSATLLAPSVAFSENILRAHFPYISDRAFLRMMRITMLCFSVVVLGFALTSEATIFAMVENASKITLARRSCPCSLARSGSVRRRRGRCSPSLAVLLHGWRSSLPWAARAWSTQLIGFGVSMIGMIVGSLLPQRIGLTHPKAAA